jgi:hypothetical protein
MRGHCIHVPNESEKPSAPLFKAAFSAKFMSACTPCTMKARLSLQEHEAAGVHFQPIGAKSLLLHRPRCKTAETACSGREGRLFLKGCSLTLPHPMWRSKVLMRSETPHADLMRGNLRFWDKWQSLTIPWPLICRIFEPFPAGSPKSYNQPPKSYK